MGSLSDRTEGKSQHPRSPSNGPSDPLPDLDCTRASSQRPPKCSADADAGAGAGVDHAPANRGVGARAQGSSETEQEEEEQKVVRVHEYSPSAARSAVQGIRRGCRAYRTVQYSACPDKYTTTSAAHIRRAKSEQPASSHTSHSLTLSLSHSLTLSLSHSRLLLFSLAPSRAHTHTHTHKHCELTRTCKSCSAVSLRRRGMGELRPSHKTSCDATTAVVTQGTLAADKITVVGQTLV
ncbi:hypothetical protein BCV70DRAFT_203285 [Testicularia cyperi]|uniref:Uncharacterized protein n=1 Tax=Testicularia cyperi TaxID=1882483 RepID=A0A317XEI2_9BASI|nr:hypothetical protein BCV70DRAFT_203285 [Testicularia cyperi]